jgi:hypothetical protein
MDAYREACQELVAAAKAENPHCLLGYSHCMHNEFLDQSMWDVVFFNDYMYTGDQLQRSLKYRGHVEWLIREHAVDKPFVLGEFGLSVSPSGPGKMGYGGNTLAEQRDGDIYMVQSMIDAGGQGGCLFMWRDGWWKFGDEMTHDDHPEEWYGVLGIDDWDSDPRGTPRPVYYAFKEYNQLILTEPRQMAAYEGGEVPVHACVTDKAKELHCRIDGGEWVAMPRTSPSWHRTRFEDVQPGHHTVEVKAELELPETKAFHRKVDVVVVGEKTGLPRLRLMTDKTAYDYGETAHISIDAVSESGAPIANLPVVLTYANHGSGGENTVEGKTDANGVFRDTFPLFAKHSFITVAAGGDAKPYGIPLRVTDAAIIELKQHELLDLESLDEGTVIESFDYEDDTELAKVRGRVLTAEGAGLEVTRETEHSHTGTSALSLLLKPTSKECWGFTEMLFPAPMDLSEAVAGSCRVFGDGSNAELKLMLVDADGERWFDEHVTIDFKGWREIRFDLQHLQRDPFDGVGDGDGRPDLRKVAGLAFTVNSRHASPVQLIIDDLRTLVYAANITTKMGPLDAPHEPR